MQNTDLKKVKHNTAILLHLTSNAHRIFHIQLLFICLVATKFFLLYIYQVEQAKPVQKKHFFFEQDPKPSNSIFSTNGTYNLAFKVVRF